MAQRKGGRLLPPQFYEARSMPVDNDGTKHPRPPGFMAGVDHNEAEKLMAKARKLIAVELEVNGFLSRRRYDIYHKGVYFQAQVHLNVDESRHKVKSYTVEVIRPATVVTGTIFKDEEFPEATEE